MDEWDQVKDLGVKTRIKMNEICRRERQDAALTAVCVGLATLNVFECGLGRLTQLSKKWGGDISNFYAYGGRIFKEYPAEGLMYAGDPICNIDAVFADLSDRRRRQIRAYFVAERNDAQWNAIEIGKVSIVNYKGLKIGKKKLAEEVAPEWEKRLKSFWEDRDIQEPRLKQWLEDEIGFIYDHGKLESYRDGDNKPIRKETAERKMAEAACGLNE